MKKNRQRLWLGMVLIILLYGTFLTYFCIAKPAEPNNIVIEQDKTTGENTSTAKIVGPEFYLSEITAFYERIITILFGVLGFLLVFSFLYVHLTSRRQAEEMARDALETKSFQIILKNMIVTRAEEFIEMYSGIPELQKRIEFLGEQVNVEGYELSDEGSGEVNDGNN